MSAAAGINCVKFRGAAAFVLEAAALCDFNETFLWTNRPMTKRTSSVIIYIKHILGKERKNAMSSGSSYSGINLYATGRHMKKLIEQSGYSVRDIQHMLHLSCPQPIYRWLKGQVLPTVDHLYLMAGILHVHMEELLVPQDKPAGRSLSVDESLCLNRMSAYWKHLRGKAA